MKRLKTLRVRFAFWTSGLFLLILTVFSAYVYGNMARGLYISVDDSLALNAAQVTGAINIDNSQLILPDSFIEAPDNGDLQTRGFTVRILSPQEEILQSFGPYHNLPSPTVKNASSFTTYVDKGSNDMVRVYTTPVEDNNHLVAYVQVAQSLESTRDTIQRLLATLLVGVPLLILVAGLSGYFLAARALAPIDQITLTARRISAKDLSARLHIPATDDEVGRLAQTFDDMLARLDNSFQRERQFTNDASHELRTPLTAMQAILGVIRGKRRTFEEYEQALDDLTEEADRLRTLVENLMRLARGEKRSNNLHEMIDISTLISDVADSLRPLAEIKNLILACDIPENLTISGDSDELIRLFVNLLDNAIKYTEHGKVTITANKHEKGMMVNVEDTGIGISPEHLPHIFDRFYRVDGSRATRGAGLGLAIAQEIAHSHRGSIEARSTMGEGSTFTVCLPDNFESPSNQENS
ncbi:MAG: sensor histidine kinase [Anaerolineales bacterium]